MNSDFKQNLAQAATQKTKKVNSLLFQECLEVQIDTIQRYYEDGRDLSVEEFKKYMNKANRYIAKFAREYDSSKEVT